MSRRHNPVRVKLDRTYTVAELAECLSVHPRTVRQWQTKGLRSLDGKAPQLFHGREVRAFLYKLNKPRHPLDPGQFYCVACKCRATPAKGEIWLTPRSLTTTDFTAQCSTCQRTIYRRVRISEVQANLGSARLIQEDRDAHVSRARDCPRTPLLEGTAA